MFHSAFDRIKQVPGHYLDRLCDEGKITLYRASDQPNWCGNANGTSSEIVFTSTCGYHNTDYTSYLFAHETGHIYWARHKDDRTRWGSTVAGENRLPTYSLGCGGTQDASEDFADNIGDYVYVNLCDCPDISNYGSDFNSFWASFPKHLQAAIQVLFR